MLIAVLRVLDSVDTHKFAFFLSYIRNVDYYYAIYIIYWSACRGRNAVCLTILTTVRVLNQYFLSARA